MKEQSKYIYNLMILDIRREWSNFVPDSEMSFIDLLDTVKQDPER